MNIEKLNIMELCLQEKQKNDKGLFEDPLNKQRRVQLLYVFKKRKKEKNKSLLKLHAGAGQRNCIFYSAFKLGGWGREKKNGQT